MRVLVSGASGLVGTALGETLRAQGHEVGRLVRRPAQGADEVSWDPGKDQLEAGDLAGFDAVVHLAGENVSGGRWTQARKKRILESRVKGTRLLAERLAALESPPSVWVSASAIGLYGDRGDEILDEAKQPGTGFLADVCSRWEAATASAPDGVRVVRLRIGLVLSERGGALAKMLPAFRAGLGGRLGDGRQYMSWITLEDLVAAIGRALEDPSLEGAVNAVSPGAVTNKEFTATLGRVLRRPTVVPAPAAALRLALGEMADELLLASARVVPRRLEEVGFEFRWPSLEGALKHLLG